MISQEIIKEAIERLVKAYDPIEIYIFGPYAWGKPDDDDDLKFLLVVETSDEKIYRRGDRAFDVLFGLKIPKSVSVFTQEEFDNYSQDITSLCHEIKTRGKVVYARR